jgi:hypothetical protein
MSKAGFFNFTAKFAICVMSLGVFALAQEDPAAKPVDAPMMMSLAVPSAGESVQLNGNVSISQTTTTDADGNIVISYFCSVVGKGKGATSGSIYDLSGNSSGTVPVSADRPVDIGFSCPLLILGTGSSQNFTLNLQGSLDESGNLTALSIQSINAL